MKECALETFTFPASASPYFSSKDITPPGKLSLTPGLEWVPFLGHAQRLCLPSQVRQLSYSSILGQTGGFMQQDCLDLVRCLFQLPLQCSSYNRNLINMCSIHDCMDKLIFVSTLSLQSTFRDKCPPYPDLFDS